MMAESVVNRVAFEPASGLWQTRWPRIMLGAMSEMERQHLVIPRASLTPSFGRGSGMTVGRYTTYKPAPPGRWVAGRLHPENRGVV